MKYIFENVKKEGARTGDGREKSGFAAHAAEEKTRIAADREGKRPCK
jgi:hypothetical protein